MQTATNRPARPPYHAVITVEVSGVSYNPGETVPTDEISDLTLHQLVALRRIAPGEGTPRPGEGAPRQEVATDGKAAAQGGGKGRRG